MFGVWNPVPRRAFPSAPQPALCPFTRSVADSCQASATSLAVAVAT